jgi:uncharacterized membrane protein YeaQ/YmgE (transglycosylase-associated protein family)
MDAYDIFYVFVDIGWGLVWAALTFITSIIIASKIDNAQSSQGYISVAIIGIVGLFLIIRCIGGDYESFEYFCVLIGYIGSFATIYIVDKKKNTVDRGRQL